LCYPWGQDWECEKANTIDEGRVLKHSPVEVYAAAGESRFMAEDETGNVWEWTSSLYSSYPYRAEDGREELNVRALRILRGGSFRSNQESARCAYRYGDYPGLTLDIGFRVALLPSKTLIENIK
jgi:formylglycine-generating enzyme required for sulfatase activity